MTNHIVIGIAGVAGSGKNTMAGMLAAAISAYGRDVFVTSLAAPIKRILRNDFGWDGMTKDDFWRKAMVQVGETACKDSKFHWCEMTDSMMQASPASVTIITDIRKMAEIAFFNRVYDSNNSSVRFINTVGRSSLTGEAATDFTESITHILQNTKHEYANIITEYDNAEPNTLFTMNKFAEDYAKIIVKQLA